jgi:1-acyl-sn-glycerol-3-phosphate acyltransferase
MTSEGGGSDELNAWWRIGGVVVGAFAHALFRPQVLNAEHIPGGPAILAANHVSVLDGPLLAWPPAARRRRAVRFLVAAENFRLPLIGSILRAFRQIPIRRGERDARALDLAVTAVRAGGVVGIFPEGRVNAGDGTTLQRIRRGAARVAIAARAPVVPVGIWGTQRRWPRGRIVLRPPGRPMVAVAFGSPIAPPADATEDGIEAFTRTLAAAIASERDRARSAAA